MAHLTAFPPGVMLAPMQRSLLVVPSIAALALWASACGGSKARSGGPESPAKSATAQPAVAKQMPGGSEGATSNVRTADLDGDGRPEVWKYYKEGSDPDKPGEKKMIIVREDLDLNWDGRPDLWRYFDDKGQVVKEEWDTDFDGKVDEVRYFENGVIAKAERDRNNDGRYDETRYYKQGKLERKEVDTNGDGKVDRWEYYNGTTLERVGLDKDHDGTIDTWAKAPGATGG
jgi:hypothetical protein